MAYKIAVSHLNASTVDIINAIRQNAPAEYQSSVPVLTKDSASLRKVGDVICGYPAFSNYFLNELINRIAFVNIKSATFNNAYAELKKGYLEFGETVEEVFVQIAKAREFSAEKAEAREFKRTIPDVRAAFHTMNWRVQYPITIQNEDLRQAFLSFAGVEDLIARIVSSLTTAAEYDEFLLFKYLLIKAVAHGKMYPVGVDGSDLKDNAAKFRGISNKLPFMSKIYNQAGVTTNTNKAAQVIFMDAEYNAEYDVNVLASAFNMDKAEFMGKLYLIDDFTTFDNERFSVIREASDGIEEVTSEELALMEGVKAILLDKEWFQIYDNLQQITEVYVTSGLYWNYNLHVWKTVSSSPFSNAVVFVDSTDIDNMPNTLSGTVVSKGIASDGATVINVELDNTGIINNVAIKFLQTEAATEDAIAIHPYGSIIFSGGDGAEDEVALNVMVGDTLYVSGTATTVESVTTYAAANLEADADVGDTVTFVKSSLIGD